MKTYYMLLLSTLILIACNNSHTSKENNKDADSASKNETLQSVVKDPISPFYLTFEYDGKQELIDLEESDLQYNYDLQYQNSTDKNELSTKFEINKEKNINFSIFFPGQIPVDITNLKGDTCLFNLKYVVRDFSKPGVSGVSIPMSTNHINDNSPLCVINQVDHLGQKAGASGKSTDWYKLTGTFEGNMADTTGTIKKIEKGRFAVVIRK